MTITASRLAFLAISLACTVMMLIGTYMERVMGLEPCPLCITQRAFIVLCGLVALVGHGVRKLVSQAMDSLNPIDRKIILLRGFEHRPAAEVAEMLGLTADGVGARYYRARRRLRKQLLRSFFADLPDGD